MLISAVFTEINIYIYSDRLNAIISLIRGV